MGEAHRHPIRAIAVDAALVLKYRAAPVKHANETGWRRDGATGYTWGFFTPSLSIFRCRDTRAAKVAQEVFGDAQDHVGTLIVDRYAAYNIFKSFIQYCFEHLKRDTLKVATDNPDEKECQAFAQELAPLLIEGMKTREVLMSVANTLALRVGDGVETIKQTLDALVADPKLNIADYLFGKDGIAKV